MPNFSNLNFNDFRTITPLPSNNQTRGDVQTFQPKPRGSSVRPCTPEFPCGALDDTNNPDTTNKISTTTIAIIGGVVVLALAGGYWFFTRKKQ